VKKVFSLIVTIVLFLTVPLPAQKMNDVMLKCSRQEGAMRIVIEAEETVIQKMNVAVSPLKVKIDMPEAFRLNSPKDLPFVLVSAERSVEIQLKEKNDVKFFRLSSPARLVLDLRNEKSQQDALPPDKKTAPAEKPSGAVFAKGVVIDAGHGGYDFGITAGSVSEKDINLSLAKDLGAALARKGKKGVLLRRVDQYLSFADRIAQTNQKSPDIFISLHASMSSNFAVYSPRKGEHIPDESADPYHVEAKQQKYVLKSKALSECIMKAIKEEFKGDVMHRDMTLPVLNGISAPSVLIEVPSPLLVTYDQQMKARIISALIAGITAYGQQQ
jgi:N-acetylmuramoyl-L-alanine amidase